MIAVISITQAQELEMDLQMRPRFEFRNGYKVLRDANMSPAAFVSQRSRIGLTYKEDNLQMRLSLQNIHIWGDQLQGSIADVNSTGIYEAYAYYHFNDVIGIKAGRQVISYDNERIFGEANWTQAARTHDVLLLKMTPGKNQQLDLGFALNADHENLQKTPYQTKNYKVMEYARYQTDLAPLSLSLLFINAGYEIEKFDGELKNDYQQTFGGFLKYDEEKFNADAALYSQQGKRAERDLNAWYGSLNINYLIAEHFVSGLGFEYLSGTSQSEVPEKNKSFLPLFGSNHAFNGFMDYFYVGNHQNTVGLKDFYAKIAYNRKKYSLQLMPHVFYASKAILSIENKAMDNYLASEIDFSASYKLQKNLILNLGYSQLFGTESLEQLKGGNSSLSQNWAWLSLTFHPKIKILTN